MLGFFIHIYIYNLLPDSNIWRSVIKAVHADERFIGNFCYEVLFMKRFSFVQSCYCYTKAVFYILCCFVLKKKKLGAGPLFE